MNYTKPKLQINKKILQIIGVPHLALLSVIFGMMLLSFPVGAFVVFNTNIGDDINFEYPITNIAFFKEIGSVLPFDVEIGDVFILLWSLYVIIFAISILGPKKGFLKTLSSILNQGRLDLKSNYMFVVTKWFSILILVSVIIDFIQQKFGIVNTSPSTDNNLVQFLYVSTSPILEEFMFRVLLIGLPLFVFYSPKFSLSYFFKSLCTPNHLSIQGFYKPLFLIVFVGIFFGYAHIIGNESWSEAKFVQATASGIILGWLYFRFGLISAVLVHWATNYFIFSYANFISQLNEVSIESAFSHSLINTMEIIFIISGIASVSMLLLNYFYLKREKPLTTG